MLKYWIYFTIHTSVLFSIVTIKIDYSFPCVHQYINILLKVCRMKSITWEPNNRLFKLLKVSWTIKFGRSRSITQSYHKVCCITLDQSFNMYNVVHNRRWHCTWKFHFIRSQNNWLKNSWKLVNFSSRKLFMHQ